MATPKNLTQIAVGSSEFIWALDADSNAVYERNPITHSFERVSSNITVASLDVSYEGHVVALDPGGNLYLWDAGTRTFDALNLEQTFDQVSIGNDTIWALRGTTVYQWDDDQGVFVEAFEGATALAVAKQDDTVYILDQSGNLQRYQYDVQDWTIVTSELGVDDLTVLAATSQGNLWGLTADGKVYQYNSLNLADADVPEATFVPQSANLGIPNVTVSHFAIDDQDILYGVVNDGLNFYDTEQVRVQNTLGEKTNSPALVKDAQGTLHLAYSNEGGVFHSFFADDEWVQAKAIPGAEAASEISLDTDALGNVYASWIQGYGNDAEVYVAKGVKNQGYGGYTWSAAHQVTDDAVADKYLDMEVTPDGVVTLTAAKIDVLSQHDDHDIYHYAIDGNGATFSHQPKPEVIDLTGKYLTTEPLVGFLWRADGLEGVPTFGLSIAPGTGGVGIKTFIGKEGIDVEAFLRAGIDFSEEGYEAVIGLEGLLGLNFGALIKPLKPILPELAVSFITDAQKLVNLTSGDEESYIGVGYRLNIAVDLLGMFLNYVSGGGLTALRESGSDIQGAIFGEYAVLFNVFEKYFDLSDDPQQESGNGELLLFTPVSPPVELVDSTGQPVSSDTPIDDIRTTTTVGAIASYIAEAGLGAFNINLGSPSSSPEGEAADFDPTLLLGSNKALLGDNGAVWAGVYFSLGYSTPENAGPIVGPQFLNALRFSAELRTGVTINTKDQEIDKVGWRTYLLLTKNNWAWRVFDFEATIKDYNADSPIFGSSPVFAEYNVGGTNSVIGDGDLVFEGLAGGSESDLLDAEEFNYVLLSDGRAIGVYLQEIIDQAQNSLNSVNTIDGQFVSTTGKIIWDPASIRVVPGSQGLNLTPKIATRDGDELVVTWGNVPEDNPDLQAVNQTPPGKAYVVYGGEGGVTLDLATLGPDAAGGTAGFYLSNDKFFYGIATSAGQLGDINPGGDPDSARSDFIFGAPDAEGEAGKAYVIFGESYAQVTDIDDLGGTAGFTLLGDFDSELGYATGTAGDFNDDGIPDIAISAPGAANHAGAVYVLYGGNDWTLNDGQFTVGDIGTTIAGTVLQGAAEGDRWGTALAGGYDVTGDGEDDLAVGSVVNGTITLVSRSADPITIEYFADSSAQTNANDVGLRDMGAAVAMLPDINEDGNADLLIGDSGGSAYVVFGGERFDTYGRDHVVSWTVEDGEEPSNSYQVLLSFNGEDANGDGILSAKAGEISDWQMEVFRAGEPVATYSLAEQLQNANFDFNYDLGTDRVLANAGAGETDLDEELYGLSVGLDRAAQANGELWSVLSSTQDQRVELVNVADGSSTGTTVAASAALGNNLFDALSTPGIFDLYNLSDLPQSGFELSADTALPLQVANAGDVNGDGVQDLIVGFDQSANGDGESVSGQSYVLYGDADLTRRSEALDLTLLTPEQGFTIGAAGGQVSAAGDVNADGFGDLLVSAPNFDTGNEFYAELAGISYVIFGSEDGSGAVGYTLTNSSDRERSGASLAPLGDLNGDGYGDFLVGAPQAVDQNEFFDATAASRLLYSTRSLSTKNAPWSEGDALNNNAEAESPLALGDTSLGTLAVWVDVVTDSEGNAIGGQLKGSFFDGDTWSGDGSGNGPISQVIRESSQVISQVNVIEAPLGISGGEVPAVFWVESDLENAETTTLYQIAYKPSQARWESEPETVIPVAAEVPPYAPDNAGETLETGSETLTVDDVHVSEGDQVASFTIVRSGDISEASGPYQFRLKDYSATYGLDYSGAHAGEFSFAAGEDTHTLDVQIHADDLDENGMERLRLEVWSEDEAAYVSHGGLAVPGAAALTASMFIEDSNTVLNLATIDSGFKLSGQSNVALGSALSSAGDLNADGISDFMIAAPTAGSNAQGKVYVLYGQSGIAIAAQDLDLDTITADQGAILDGRTAHGQAGTALAYGQSDNGPFVAIGTPGTSDESSQGRVFVVRGESLDGQAEVPLNNSNALRLSLSADSKGDVFGRALTVANLNNSGGDDDLIVTSGDAIHVVYDVSLLPETGTVRLNDLANVTTIINSEGTGFGDGLVVTDFDGDGYVDVIVGSSRGNALLDTFDVERGAGGFVAVIRGGADGLANSIDVNSLGGNGFKLLGQATFAPKNSSPTANPINGAAEQSVRPGFALVDGVGDAIAAVDLNGDGIKDLAIGAPQASLADADGQQTVNGLNKGRIYVLFGGSDSGQDTDWSDLSGNYELLDLYGNNAGNSDRFKDGIILEGTELAGLAGAALSNVGFFRGETDEAFMAEDLAIGAPGVNAGAGQAYLVFGSEINYADLGKSRNVFAIDPTVDPSKAGVLPLFGYQGNAKPLNESNTSNTGAVGFAVAGLGDIDATAFGSTGGTELALGAPFIDIDGNGQAYVATGHSWIQPGTSLEVKDLRSDNGFITPISGNAIWAGDVDQDGYDDFIVDGGDALTLVLGASIYDIETSTDREIALDTLNGNLSKEHVAVGDFDGDGAQEIIAVFNNSEGQKKAYIIDSTLIPTALSLQLLSTGIDFAFYSADINGDGYDDLVGRSAEQVNSSFTRIASSFDISHGNGTFQRLLPPSGLDFNELIDWITRPLASLADLNNDGQDEVISVTSSATEPLIFAISKPENGHLIDQTTFTVADLVPGTPFSNTFTNGLHLPSSAGDVNGDGYQDVAISFLGQRQWSEVNTYENVTLVLLGAAEWEDLSGILIYSENRNIAFDFSSSRILTGFSAIPGDINQDGYDDILVSNTRNQDPFVIYGGEDLPSAIALPNAANAADFAYGFAIQGLPNRKQPYNVEKGGDLNGDGVSDFVLSDPTYDLTYGIYGERKSGLLGVTYMDGTPEDDYLVQSESTNPISVLGKEGDDFIQTLSGTRVVVYAGEGDDQIGLGQVDSSEIGRIDGGAGLDTLFLNADQLGQLNTLDLTKIPGRITGIEVIDLGTLNGLTFDVPSLITLTGAANTLIVKGTQAQAKPKLSLTYNGWSSTGENAFDGSIYKTYQYQYEDGTNTNIQVWIEKGGVEWSPLKVGTSGDDVILGTEFDDDLDGGEGNDLLFGGPGDDLLRGGLGIDTAYGGEGSDTFVGLAAEHDGDRIGDLGADDEIVFEDHAFGVEIATVAYGAAEIRFDQDGDGTQEGVLYVAGDIAPTDTFAIERVGDDVVITLIPQVAPDPITDGGGTSGDNVLTGSDEADVLAGGSGDDGIDGNGGDDRLEGGSGNDEVLGGTGDDTIRGGSGADALRGGSGDDQLTGGSGSDEIDGGDGNDVLLGGSGADVLRGGFGDDELTGDSGRDLFVLAAGEGTDTVTDFRLRQDKIGLADGLTRDALTFDGHAIMLGAEVLATLVGVDATQLTNSDFMLV